MRDLEYVVRFQLSLLDKPRYGLKPFKIFPITSQTKGSTLQSAFHLNFNSAFMVSQPTHLTEERAPYSASHPTSDGYSFTSLPYLTYISYHVYIWIICVQI